MKKGEINFFYEDCEDFALTNSNKIKRWLNELVKEERCYTQSINYIFCDDEYLHAINIEYLNHDTYTDIITFDNSEEEGVIEGDVFISIDRVKENAVLHGTTFENELLRVMAHGVLHLVGYGDKTEKEKMEMREKENTYLSKV